jgi:hypothetical protein
MDEELKVSLPVGDVPLDPPVGLVLRYLLGIAGSRRSSRRIGHSILMPQVQIGGCPQFSKVDGYRLHNRLGSGIVTEVLSLS